MTTEEKAVIDAAIELYHQRGDRPFFHIILGKLDSVCGTLVRKREQNQKIAHLREPWASENTDGTWMVMDGEQPIAREKTKAEADEYVAAMKRGDI